MTKKPFLLPVIAGMLISCAQLIAAPLAPTNLRVVDKGYMHISLEWTDNSSFGDILILERKKASEANFKPHVRLPHKAGRYRDLGIEDSTSYTYRMATRSNGSFSSWAQVSATTDLNPWTKTFNVKNYGAVGNGIVDDTKAIRATIQAVYAEGGGIVYLPSGTYAVAPDAGAGVIFYLEKGNIFFKGDGPDKTIISCFVSGMRDPETNWDYNDKGELTRGICFILNLKWLVRNSNFVFEDLRVTGNARPTGDTLWWTNEQKENGWDISHKGIYLGSMNDNILLRNTVWDNFRGEIVYSGDPWGGKLKMEDCKVYGTNSSAISTSADFECLRTEVWDAANACVESAFFKDLNDIENTPQNGIFKDSIFRNRDKMLTDKSANPLLTDETTGLEGLAIFNAPGTYMVVDNCEIRNTSKWGILMDVGQRNFAVLDTIFEDCSRIGGIYTETKDKKDYQLTGEIINFLVEGCTFIANTDSIIFDTANFHPKLQKDMLFRNNKIYLNGGKSIIHFDSHNHEGLRENLVFDGNEVIYNGGKLVRFSYDVNKSSYPAIKPIWKENNKFSIPDYFESGDATEYVLYNTPAGPQNLVIHGPYMKVYNLPAGSLVELEITQYLHRYPEGFQTTFLRSASQGRAVFRKNPEWNDFPEDIYLDKGNSFNIRKEDSLFRLKEWNGKRVLSFRDRGFFDAVAANDTAATYGVFTGVADHEEVIVAVTEDNVTLENNDRLRLSNNTSYTHIGAPVEFKFVRDGNVLIEIERQSCNRSLVKLD